MTYEEMLDMLIKLQNAKDDDEVLDLVEDLREMDLVDEDEDENENLIPRDALYIKGYLTLDYNGIPAVAPNKEDSYFSKTSIVDSIKSYAESNGFVREHNKGFGGHQVFIRNCNMRAYFCKRECSLETAQRNFDALLYGGDLATETEYTGYSEWTITGMDLNEFTLGGHDLKRELDSHMGEYIHLIIECN